MIAFLIFCCLDIAISKENKPAGKVLVLGFSSRYINDFQDRLLRETVMRGLCEKGYRIVPIMELERFFQDYHTGIQNVKNFVMEDLCKQLGASFAVKGYIAAANGKFVYNLPDCFICILRMRRRGQQFRLKCE